VFSKLKQWFSLDMFEKGEEKRMARILLSIILICWLASLLVLLIDLIWWEKKLVISLIIGSILQLIPFGLLLRKKLSASSFILVGIYILLTTTIATIGYGVRDYVMMVYPIIIMIAGLTAQQRGLFFSTLLTFAAFGWLIFGETNGWFVVQKSFIPGGTDLLVAGILIIIAAWAVYLLVSNAQHGLSQTWRELAERKRIEGELRESRENFQGYFNMGAVGMAVTTPEKTWIEVNDRMCQIFGYSKEELSKMTWTELTHPNDLEANLKLFDQMTAGKIDSYQLDKRYIRKDKSVVYTTIFATCHRNPNGTVRHLLTSVIDITERKQAENELRKLTLAVEQSPASIVITDLNGNIEYVNPRFTQTTGYSFDEATGKNPRILKTDLTPTETHRQLWDTLTAGKEWHGEFVNRKKDDTVYYESAIISPITDLNGVPTHYLAVKENITERKRNETILQIRLDLTEFAAAHSLDEFMQKALDEIADFTESAIGFYHFVEPDQKTLSLQAWSTRTLEEFCKAEGKGMHYDIDKAGIWVECVTQGKPVIHNDYASESNRKGLPPGHAGVVRELVVPVYHGGKVVSILGVGNKPSDYTEKDVETVSYLADVVWEIVKRKQMEQSLLEAQSRLSLLGDNLEEAALYVYSHDVNGQPHFEYVSASMEKIIGVKSEEVLQNAASLLSTVLPEYIPRLAELEESSKESLKSFEMEVCQRHTISGEIHWALLRSTPRRRADGSTVWYGVQVDITERKRNEKLLEEANEQLRLHVQEIEQLQEELREQAIRDALTGLYNRRYMQDVFKQEFSRARRENYPISVIMLDMDELKVVNDTHGHHAGDQALQALAVQLQSMTRKEDIVCRYGGDEFTVILSKTFPKDAVKRVEEWRASLNNHPIELDDNATLPLKFTAGIASFPVHGISMEEIINYADVALYRAKARGRNCTVVFEEGGS